MRALLCKRFHQPLLGVVLASLLLFAGPGSVSASEASPYELETGRELALTGIGLGLAGTAWLLDRKADPLTAEQIQGFQRSSVPGVDRGATRRWDPKAGKASDILLGVTALSPTAVILTDRGRKEPWTLGVMYLETVLLTNGAMALLKSAVSRTRPFVYNDDPEIPLEKKMGKDAQRSFPSGHTANAFAGAVLLSTTYEALYPGSDASGWIWATSLLAASTTGYLRYAAGKHFPTDIVAGAALGVFVGWLVPELHEVDPATNPGSPPLMTFSFRF